MTQPTATYYHVPNADGECKRFVVFRVDADWYWQGINDNHEADGMIIGPFACSGHALDNAALVRSKQ